MLRYTNKLCATRLNDYLNPRKYIGGILKQFGMFENKSIQTPFKTTCKLSKDMGFQSDANFEAMWVILSQNVIRSFMYAMVCTRFNITQVGGVVSQFMANLIVKQIFYYLKGIVDFWSMLFKKHQGCYYGQGTFW